ncbi:MAG: hypothetical protein HDS24_05700 [Bacteroides sp.]|nr:hypothetical protein [Bacteroides sp.]
MTLYNVLWLDDYFVSMPKDDKDINENYRKAASGFLRDIRKVEESGISVKGVPTFEEFAEEFKKNPDQYQGVVFDLRGMANASGEEASDYVVADAIELVNQIKPVPMYVYSANTDLGKFEMTIRHIVESGRAFDKGKLVRNLINKMLEDFDSSFHFYAGHEECLKLFNEGFLASHLKPVMDKLLKEFNNLSERCNPYTLMRKILENMTRKLCEIGLLDLDPDSSSLNKRIRYLAEYCHFCKDDNGDPGKGIPDFNNPIVPYSIINVESKNLLRFLGMMTNNLSHFNPNDSSSYYGTNYNINVLKASYYAFFAVMQWYYTFMSKRESLI